MADAPESHHLWVRAALATVPATKADRTEERAWVRASQLVDFRVAIAEASAKRAEPRKYAALLITIAQHESHLDTEVVAGRCPPRMCDRGRAKGAFQNWNVKLVSDVWHRADGKPALQVEMADRVLSRSLTRCATFAPFPAHVFRAYRGGAEGSCTIPLKDEEARVATFNRLMSVQVKP